MTEQIDGQRIRQVMLEVINDHSKREHSSLQSRPMLMEAVRRLGMGQTLEREQALLTFFHDLFRQGYLAWGYDISNSEPPFCHLTERGRKVLETLSRDPANPDGYLAHLSKIGSLNPIALAYLKEALETYNTNCFKASAVMTGAAAESLTLELRDDLIGRMNALGKTPAKNLNDWRILTVLRALHTELNQQVQMKNMSAPLAETFGAYWPAFTQQIRKARNEAGHPANIDPVTPETVHASLLIFPELVRLTYELKAWIPAHYA